MLELKKVTCSYGKVRALNDVSRRVDEGALVSILGTIVKTIDDMPIVFIHL